MPIVSAIDGEAGILFERWEGEITLAELRDFWSERLPEALAAGIGRSLADIREATLGPMGAELRELLARTLEPALTGQRWRTAIVVATPAQYGVSRQYQVYTARFAENSIFYDADEALRWLRSDQPPADAVEP